MASIAVQVALVLALFTTYSLAQAVTENTDVGGQCQNSFPNSGLAFLVKVYERVSNLEMEIKNTKERLNSCGCGGGGRCLSNPCENGGTCDENTDSDGYQCTCTALYLGIHCERISRCLSNPCIGGTCSELTDSDGFKCTCNPYYFGTRCNIVA